MKPIVVVAGLLLAVGTAVVACYRALHVPPRQTAVVVLRDVTDSFAAHPNAGELLALFDLRGAQPWSGARLRVSSITDVSHNRVSEARLDPANKWLSNELERGRHIERFEADVVRIVDNSGAVGTGKNHSSVFYAVAQQLTYLSGSGADAGILIVYSDLMENTPELSFYDTRVLAALRERPDEVVRAWEGRLGPATLAGIDVYLIHQPASAADDAAYQTVSGFYRQLLEGKGARVTVSANLLPTRSNDR